MNQTNTYLNGRLHVLTVAEEMRMSHSIHAPRVIDLRSGTVLLDLTGELWDLIEVKESSHSITLIMRKYPGTLPQAELMLVPGQSGGVFNGQQLDSSELVAALATYS